MGRAAQLEQQCATAAAAAVLNYGWNHRFPQICHHVPLRRAACKHTWITSSDRCGAGRSAQTCDTTVRTGLSQLGGIVTTFRAPPTDESKLADTEMVLCAGCHRRADNRPGRRGSPGCRPARCQPPTARFPTAGLGRKSPGGQQARQCRPRVRHRAALLRPTVFLQHSGPTAAAAANRGACAHRQRIEADLLTLLQVGGKELLDCRRGGRAAGAPSLD